MNSRRFLKKLSQYVRGSGARWKSRSLKASKVRRAVFEQLENRRLFVADLVNFLTTEHVDINLQRSGSAWFLGPRNSDEVPPVQYANDQAVMYVGEPAIVSRPSGIEYDFTGVAAGSNLYVLPMAQNQDLLYQGFAAYGLAGQDIDPYNAVAESKGRVVSPLASRWAKATLTDVRHTAPDGAIGTGQFSLWQTGSFGEPSVLMSSYNDGVSNANTNGLDVTDGVTSDDALWIQRGAHLHYNFGFTQPGRYEVDLELSAYFGDDGLSTPNIAGFSQSDDITIYFSVMSVGQLQFDASSYAVDEEAGTASINVVRVGGSDGRISVNYATSNGTATSGLDYISTSGMLEFLDGETTKSISIPILDDSVDEAGETINLTLNAAGPQNINSYLIDIEEDANGILGGIATAVLTIVDNDGQANTAPTISDIADQSTDEDTATGAIPFIVGDAQTAAGALVVTATSSNTTLVPNGNIVFGGSGANRTLTITPAVNQVGPTTITVTVTDAGGLQASDTFVLTVGDPVRATFDRSAGIASATQPIDVRLVDIDNDGDLDVLFTEYNQSISILPNHGNGTFGAEVSLSALTVSDIHVADVNGDNLPDIVSSVYTDNTYDQTAIAVWRNLGAGAFSARELVESTRNTVFVALTGVGDVDGDGLNDLMLSVDGASYVRNLGSGAFGPVTNIFTGGITWSSALHDVDQDGDLDVVRAFDDNGVFRLQLFRNSGASTPVFAAEELASFGSHTIRNLAIADTNQDGLVDIHLLRGASSRTEIITLHGASTGAFMAPVTLGSAAVLHDLKIGDIDGDGRPDLASSSRDQNQVLFAQNLGAGVFTDLQQFTSDGAYLNPGHEAVVIGDIDGDGRNDLVYTERFGDRIAWSRNRQEEIITALSAPASRTYLNGYPMTFDVFLGFNVLLNTSSGSPTLPVTIGSQTIQVPFVGQPNANTLRFRYQVGSTDLDLDGIQVANSVALNGATITDIHDRPLAPAFLQFAPVNTTGVLVNGGAPYVTGIMRLDATPAATSSVRYAVTFSESVTGVTLDDFTLDANGPTGASITSVTGSGSSYVVTADIGSGDGTLKLRVLDDDSIMDANSHPLGGVGTGNGEFAYGQGYTIRSSTATPVFNNVIMDGHLDVSLLLYEGDWYPYWNGVGFWDTTDTVISAGPDARALRPADAKWDFLGTGAGEPVWIFPETFSTTTPWPGVGAYDNQPGTFASYFESDPRVNSTAAWLKMQLLDVRGPEGGEFSLYQSGITDPTVFMASANGIGPEDTAWIPNLDHIHYNWAFSKSGLYQVDVIASGYVDLNLNGTYEPGVDPLSESQIITLHFAVELSAKDDTFKVTGREALRGSVTLNDQSEWGLDATTTTVESTTMNGTLSLQPNGSFTYQPSATFNGSDSFTYRLTNPGGGFTTATVSITGSTRPDFDAVLKAGHADIGVNFEVGAWDLHVHNHEPDMEYEPSEALLYVGSDSRVIRSGDSANSAYDFLGVPAGSAVFVLPQVENTNLLFLGIGGEELGLGLLEGDVATLRLVSVSGPGEFSVWQAGPTATTPKLIMATSDGIGASDFYDIGAGSHAHANFAFTRKGFYEVTFVASGVDVAGNETDSGMVTYYFEVGNDPVVLTRLNATVMGEVQSTLANTGTWADPESSNANVVLSASIGAVVKNADGTWAWSHTPTTYMNNIPVTITANDGVNSSEVVFNVTANTFAAGRSVFYNNATGDNLSSEGAANNAIDSSKSVLRTPGATSTFANYTNYSLGLNGLIVDIAGLPATVTDAQMLSSLQFAHWNAISAGGFTALPAAAIPSVSILSNSGVGGSSRIKITFPNNTVQNTWLRVTVLANTTTGLANNDVFYFGNVIGDVGVGNTATRLRVNATDTGAVRSNQSTAANSASVTNIYDVNRDGRVNATDTGIVRSNQQTAGIVAPLTIPSSAPPAGARPSGSPSAGSTSGVSKKGGAEVGEGAGKEAGSFSYAISSTSWLNATNSELIDTEGSLESTIRSLSIFDANASLPVVRSRILSLDGLIEEKREQDLASQKKSLKSRELSWHDAFFASLDKLL